MTARVLFFVCFGAGTLLLAAGCGDTASQPQATTANGLEQSSPASARQPLPTAAIAPVGQQKSSADEGDDGAAAPRPKQGSPEWLISEVVKLRLKPVPQTDDLEALRADRKQRNSEIIRLATEAVAQTHQVPNQERLLNVAVHHLLEARLQLAMLDDAEQVEAIYDDAAALYKRDPQSKAAAEAAHALVRLAHANAQRHGEQEPRWLQEFARQARMFAANFPQEEKRAVPFLVAAGQSCELHGRPEEAAACYAQVQQNFANSPFARPIPGILRRLRLQGQAVQLAGPTLDGSYKSIDDYKGNVVLVVFWATQVQSFAPQIARLNEIEAKHGPSGLRLLGVNLDEEELVVADFLDQAKLTWPQIFFSEDGKRGWNNPIATYYGINNLPTLWLIDQNGIVVDTTCDLSKLDAQLAKLLKSR